MTLTERKKKILCNMEHLLDAREYLINNNKSLEAQMEIKNNRRYENRYLIEIESPLVGGTDADWIRLCYDDVYLFLHDDGTEWYQLDPLAEYGGELINAKTYEDFVSELKDITYDLEEFYISYQSGHCRTLQKIGMY